MTLCGKLASVQELKWGRAGSVWGGGHCHQMLTEGFVIGYSYVTEAVMKYG